MNIELLMNNTRMFMELLWKSEVRGTISEALQLSLIGQLTAFFIVCCII